MAIQALELLRHVEQRLDDRLLLDFFGEARLVGDGFRQLDGVGGIGRHHLAQPVDLSVGHLQDATHVAENRACLQCSEGDDLRDLLAAVFLLHVADHLVAAVLTEIDVEVGHRHAFGVQEPLEQQREAQRIDIGDGQRPGHHRTGARPAPRPDRNAARLGPFDEVRHDQEIARIFHALDDAELEFQPLAVILFREARRHAKRRQPRLEALTRLRLHLLGLRLQRLFRIGGIGGGEARQDRRARLRIIGAPARDLDCVVDRFGKIGEKRDHLGLAAQMAVFRQPAAVVDGDNRSFGDRQQRVMRLVVVTLGKEGFVGGHQRQFMAIGKFDRGGLDSAIVARRPLEFDIEPIAEQGLQEQKPALGKHRMFLLQRLADRPALAARQADHPSGQFLEPSGQNMGRLGWRRIEKGAADEAHQIGIAFFIGRDQHDGRAFRPAAAALLTRVRALLGLETQIELASDDRLDALLHRLLGEFQRAEQIVGVGHRDRRRTVRLGMRDDLGERQGAFEQRIGGMDTQMDEMPIRHRRNRFAVALSRPLRRRPQDWIANFTAAHEAAARENL